MQSLPLWTARHALALWGIVLILALLAGDRLWRLARRRRLAATGKPGYRALPPRSAAILLVLFGALFALLFWAVRAGTVLVGFDATLAQALHGQMSPDLLGVLAIATDIGKPALLLVASAVLALLLAWKRRWRLFLPWCVAMGGTLACGEATRHFVKRMRPFDGHAFVVEAGYSFPSGHAMLSTAFFGMQACLLLYGLDSRHHRAVVAGAVALIGFVGLSRVVLMAHYLSDVLAGYALGAFWLVLGIATAELLRRDTPARHSP